MEIPFFRTDISDKEIEYVKDAVSSIWITTGPRVKELEKRVSEFVDAKKCVCLNSQTACAELALRVLGLKEGDEVITSAYTYTASASVVCHVGAKLVLIDTQKDSLEMDYDALENAITLKTKAIIPVDIAGVPCDYERIFKIVNAKRSIFNPSSDIQRNLGRIAIMSDTAHALGATYKGKKIGSVADFSSFSFHAVKNLTTAEGGAVTWNHIEGVDDDELYHKFQLLSLHGQSKDAFSKNKPGAWEYDIVGTWYKCNMTDIAAAMGLAQLERYNDMLLRRKSIIEKYDNAFKNLNIKTLNHYTSEHSSSGHLYIVEVNGIDEKTRNDIITKMAGKGVSCNVHYKPLPMHTAYKNLGFDIKDYPNAFNHYKCEITLPLFSSLKDEEVDYIIDTFTSVLKDYKC